MLFVGFSKKEDFGRQMEHEKHNVTTDRRTDRARELYCLSQRFHPSITQSSGGNPENGANLIRCACTLLVQVVSLQDSLVTHKRQFGKDDSHQGKKVYAEIGQIIVGVMRA